MRLNLTALAYCWGLNRYGQLGTGNKINYKLPVTVLASGALAGNVALITAGDSHTCAVTNEGAAYCWGYNISGQLGTGNTVSSTEPAAVLTSGTLTGKTVAHVTAGYAHSCAITTDGAVYCWGSNSRGQLGNGKYANPTSPLGIMDSGVLTGKLVSQVTTGGIHGCAVTSDGEAYCWGSNWHGQLGNGNRKTSFEPVAVLTSGALAGKSVAQVSAGIAHTCAVTTDGKAYCWGSNTNGQLGNGKKIRSTKPVAVLTSGALAGKSITQISAGGSHTCAVTSDGATYCWGWNQSGQLGTGNNIDSSKPVAVMTNSSLNGKSVIQISAGQSHTCAVTTDGTAHCWGSNQYGRLGTGTRINSNKPSAVVTNYALAGKFVTQVTAGFAHTCAISIDGGAYCWGWNENGQLGTGNKLNLNVPWAVLTSGALKGKTVTRITSGASHTCAITSDGGGYCWGSNYNGQLGTGNYDDSNKPVMVINDGALAGKLVSEISAGTAYTLALTKMPLDATVTVADKLYDGTTTANISTCTLNLVADDLSCDTGKAHAAFTDAEAGQGKLVTVTGLTLTGTQAPNYHLNSATVTTFATIHPTEQASLQLTSPVNSLLVGESITLTINGGSGDGAVSLSAVTGGEASCSLNGNTLIVGGGVGSCSVTATKAASANYLAATSNTVDIAVELPLSRPVSK